MLGAGGCSIVANPDYMPDESEDGSTSEVPADASTTGEWGVACGEDLPSDAAGPCPEECDRCDGGVCWFDCATEQACKEATLTCPPDRACAVSCGATQACTSASVICSDSSHRCTVECTGDQACEKLDLQCGAGTCELSCGSADQPCKSARLQCGANEAAVTCVGPEDGIALAEDPMSACGCAITASCFDSAASDDD